jgi:hypothetical protein
MMTFEGVTLGASRRQTILQKLLEFGTHRGDVFTDDDHTGNASECGGATFKITGASMHVVVK